MDINDKTCCRCSVPKDRGEFHKASGRKDGLYPVCKACRSIETKKYSRNTYNKKYFKTDSGRYVRYTYMLKHSYNLSEEEFSGLRDKTKGVCPVCLEGFKYGGRTTKGIAIDHNHVTGEVRGVLCKSCNAGLGQLGDTLEAAKRLVNYLEESR